MIQTRRNYKDSLFCFLFGREEMKNNLISLVEATTGEYIPKDAEVTINTLENFIYIGIKNDVSCIIGNNLYSFEHQSTENPNMPLRQAIYTFRLYEGYLADAKIYGHRKVMLPFPHCIVLCNDPNMKEEKKIYKLSDSFKKGSFGETCEWTVTCFNINAGHNEQIMKICNALKEYSEFVKVTRQYQDDDMELKDAIDVAITECIKKGILVDVLRKHRMEVADMLFTEYDHEECIKQNREEAFEEGKESGREEGREKGREEGEAAILKLSVCLAKDGRIQELAKLNDNPQLVKQYLKEYGIE